MASGPRNSGDFCWINMLTPRPTEAMAFFGDLLGWTFFEMPGLGHGMRVGGRDIGGLFDIEGPNTPPGLSPTIGLMIRVDHADAVCERVALLGGRAKPAFDVGEQGRMAVCFDPNGGEFDVWEPKQMAGTEADSSLHGAPSWFEGLTTDVPRAAEFYTSLFGWTSEIKTMPELEYTVFRNLGVEVAGLMAIQPRMAGLRPHWATYFTVDDADETARLAMNLGASMHVPPIDIPGIGRFCGLVSPQGVPFSVITYIPRMSPEVSLP